MEVEVTPRLRPDRSLRPVTVCAWHEESNALHWQERARLKSRLRVCATPLLEAHVANPETHCRVPRDGGPYGEIFMRATTVMKGESENPKQTRKPSRGAFHTGRPSGRHPTAMWEIRDLLKDIIISGGENISTIESKTLTSTPPSRGRVVSRPDEKWCETPCAFITLKGGHQATMQHYAVLPRHLAGSST